jgi:hypothetical protein
MLDVVLSGGLCPSGSFSIEEGDCFCPSGQELQIHNGVLWMDDYYTCESIYSGGGGGGGGSSEPEPIPVPNCPSGQHPKLHSGFLWMDDYYSCEPNPTSGGGGGGGGGGGSSEPSFLCRVLGIGCPSTPTPTPGPTPTPIPAAKPWYATTGGMVGIGVGGAVVGILLLKAMSK